MRLAHINGRLVIKGPEGYVDAAEASGGRFGPDAQTALADWDAFATWAREFLASPDAATAPGVGTDADTVWGPPVPGRPRSSRSA
ncbi:hypothetical protein [Streptomyces sp. CA-132043]|uniref:hypothetical protein n=1 Tax=Streptomyces sp. CA-132043 TaxID=3240048 RepID=UPI003D91CB51